MEKVPGGRSAKVEIFSQGEGAGRLPQDEKNIVWQSMRELFRAAHFSTDGYVFKIRQTNRIPLARGLGSSAAARLSGVLAANALCTKPLNEQRVLELAVRLEGHPDNIVPALFGGLGISALDQGKVLYVRMPAPPGLRAAVAVPEFELSTKKARAVLPKKVLHTDAVFNVSRVSMLVGALAGRNYKLLDRAMDDRLHQTYRKKLVPGLEQAMENARKAGALGSALSGAGPTVFAFAEPVRALAVANALARGFASRGIKAQARVFNFSNKGAQVSCQ